MNTMKLLRTGESMDLKYKQLPKPPGGDDAGYDVQFQEEEEMEEE